MAELVMFDRTSGLGWVSEDFDLDLAYGFGTDGENDFELVLNDVGVSGDDLVWGVDGTDIGGVVDRSSTSHSSGVSEVSFKGRSWHGVLANKVLCPDDGADYLKVSGRVSQVLASLFERVHVDSLFDVEAADDDKTVSYQFERYVDAWHGIHAMLAENDLKLSLVFRGSGVVASACKVVDHSDVFDSDLMDFKADRYWRRTNHLIGLGGGELRDRKVVHWYADADGNVSQSQTLTGLDELAAVYDYSNADDDELSNKTRDKLKEMQGQGTVDATLHADVRVDVGDIVSARDNDTGVTVSSVVAKKVVKASGGVLAVSYEVGEDDASVSLSGSSESSGNGGGGVYTAGPGIDISGQTISAEVTGSDFEVMDGRVTANAKAASDASAAAANALGVAQRALKPDWNALVNMPGFMGADEVDALF